MEELDRALTDLEARIELLAQRSRELKQSVAEAAVRVDKLLSDFGAST